MTENEISYKIIGAALEVHKNLGVGLLESAYETGAADQTWRPVVTADCVSSP